MNQTVDCLDDTHMINYMGWYEDADSMGREIVGPNSSLMNTWNLKYGLESDWSYLHPQ